MEFRSARQYKRKVLEWGLGKNIPGSAMRTIFETEGPPRPDENRDYVLPDGTVVPRHKVLRWWRAYRKRHVGTCECSVDFLYVSAEVQFG